MSWFYACMIQCMSNIVQGLVRAIQTVLFSHLSKYMFKAVIAETCVLPSNWAYK